MKAEKEREFKEILARIEAKDERLQEVNLNDFGLNGGDVLALLVDVLPGSKVTSLDLGLNKIGQTGAKALSQVLAQTQITSLNLRDNKIREAGAIALARVLAQTQIKSLDLMGNQIGEAGTTALVQVLAQTKITNLGLGGNEISATETMALSQVLVQKHIAILNLSNNLIGDEGIAALTKVLAQSQVISLNLESNYIADTGATALSQVLAQTQITSLDLGGNQIGDAGIIALAQVLEQTQITTLNLGRNQIGDAGATALSRVLEKTQITTLNLGYNQIGDVGATALSRVLAQTRVANLNLEENIRINVAVAWWQELAQMQITSLNSKSNEARETVTTKLSQVLENPQITSLNLRGTNIGDAETISLAQILENSQITNLDLGYNRIGVAAFVQVLANTRITSLNLRGNAIGDAGAIALAQVLEKAQITSLDLAWNEIGDAGIVALAQILANTQITSLNLGGDGFMGNNIGHSGVAALAQMLANTRITNLDLGYNQIGDMGAKTLAQVLTQTQITRLNLERNQIGDAGVIALSQVLAQTQITHLNLEHNEIGGAGVAALFQVLAETRITSLNLAENGIRGAGVAALLQAVKLSHNITEINGLKLSTEQESILIKSHLSINKLLNSQNSQNSDLKSSTQFIQELESNALLYINQPSLLDDASFEKPKKLLLKSEALGSTQASYLLGNLYLNELKDVRVAEEYYLKAATNGHEISRLCLKIISQKKTIDILELGDLRISMPRRFSSNTRQRKLCQREEDIATLTEANILVSKTGISLAALNWLLKIEALMDVYVASQDHEPNVIGHLHFSQGQTIYIEDVGDIRKNFSILVRSFIPYNRDKQGNKRADVGLIPHDIYLKYCKRKPRKQWTAEEVCNAIIVPMTKPNPGERSKSYVDTLPVAHRGKPFEGYILSYARSTKFVDILTSLNERFKGQNLEEIFIWIDLAGINQHAWMDMKSEDIGKVLEVNLNQLFTYVSDGRLIHFDKARPANLTRSWCLVELLSCLKAQEDTVAQTEICMSSGVQAEVLAQDLMQLLNSLDSSKAQCFNPQDKIAIDAQIKRSLTDEGETEISMDIAFARLNAVVKSWLVTKFLPDFSNITKPKELQGLKGSNAQEHAGGPLTLAYNSKKAAMANPLLQETATFEASMARFQPRAKNAFE